MARSNSQKAKSNKMELPIVILQEGERFVAYTPLLDLSTSGKTMEEAKRNLGEAVDLFFEEMLEQGTMDEVLRDLGWNYADRTWQPPVVVSPSEFFVVHLPIEV